MAGVQPWQEGFYNKLVRGKSKIGEVLNVQCEETLKTYSGRKADFIIIDDPIMEDRMSTKIYNAYKYNGTITELHKELFRMRLDCRQLIENKLIEIQHGRMDFWDLSAMMGKGFGGESFAKRIGIDDCAIIYPHEDNLYVQFFNPSDLGDYRSEVMELNGNFKDYHYQNQTDKPDEVSDEDWEERGRVWDEIFEGLDNDAPTGAGLRYTFITEMGLTLLAHDAYIKEEDKIK